MPASQISGDNCLLLTALSRFPGAGKTAQTRTGAKRGAAKGQVASDRIEALPVQTSLRARS